MASAPTQSVSTVEITVGRFQALCIQITRAAGGILIAAQIYASDRKLCTPFTEVSSIQTGFIVWREFAPLHRLSLRALTKQITPMCFVLNCHYLLWHKHLI